MSEYWFIPLAFFIYDKNNIRQISENVVDAFLARIEFCNEAFKISEYELNLLSIFIVYWKNLRENSFECEFNW